MNRNHISIQLVIESIFLLLFINTLSSQNSKNKALRVDIGPLAGASYYLGDINPERQFYSPGLAVGGLFKINFDSRYAFRLSVIQAKISGNDKDFDNPYQQARAFNFSNSLTDFRGQMEFNFFPFEPGSDKNWWTPYVAAGLSAYLISNTAQSSMRMSIPFGFGFKVAPFPRLTFGIEWCIQKTFYDYLDNLNDSFTSGDFEYKQKSFIENNDYYSLAGIYITYKFFTSKYTCPAFASPFSKRRR